MKDFMALLLAIGFEWFVVRKPLRDQYKIMEEQHRINRIKMNAMLESHKQKNNY
jgi:hypothetical protein